MNRSRTGTVRSSGCTRMALSLVVFRSTSAGRLRMSTRPTSSWRAISLNSPRGSGLATTHTPFQTAGVMWRRAGLDGSRREPILRARERVLEDVLEAADRRFRSSFFIPDEQRERWAYLKGPKDIPRIAKNGHEYLYSEGGIAFPDPIDQPSRTILTGEGGVTPSRFKHVIDAGDGRLRRLTPLELERLNGFPDDWTDTGMPDGRRAFMMGNALVVGLVESGRAGLWPLPASRQGAEASPRVAVRPEVRVVPRKASVCAHPSALKPDDQDGDGHDRLHHLEPCLRKFERAHGAIHPRPTLECLGREEGNPDIDPVLRDHLVGFAGDVQTRECPRHCFGDG